MSGDLHQTSAHREEDAPEPPQLRRLRRLVSFLMVAMIFAILVVAGALVWRLASDGSGGAALPPSAAEIQVPTGFEILSISRAGNRLYLVMRNGETGERQLEERAADTFETLGTYRLILAVE